MDQKERQILVDRDYLHFKGIKIHTMAIAIHTETGEKMVIYKHEENGEIYARPYDMFISEVDHEKYPDVKQKYRFELIGEKGMKDYEIY